MEKERRVFNFFAGIGEKIVSPRRYKMLAGRGHDKSSGKDHKHRGEYDKGHEKQVGGDP